MDMIFEENVKITTKEIEEKLFVEVEEIWSPQQTIFDPRDPSVKLIREEDFDYKSIHLLCNDLLKFRQF